MIDQPTFKEIKMLHSQGHTFTFITMSLELEDEVVKIAINSRNYAEFEKALQVVR
jgi:hypothetical protein